MYQIYPGLKVVGVEIAYLYRLKWTSRFKSLPTPKGYLCQTLCTLYMHYRLICPRWSNILKPSIPNKPGLRARLGWTIMNYAFYVNTYQSGGEVQGNTQTEVSTYRLTDLIGQTCIPTWIDTTHKIGLGFSPRRIQSDFFW